MTTNEIRYTENEGVRIAYESFGDTTTGDPLLLVMGLDFQMVWWPDELVEGLVAAGFSVVRFDNRDTGLSTHFDPVEKPSPWKALMGRVPPAYTGGDMIQDALAVMDAVGWSSAHVMGASMGAAIAQGIAMEHPQRVRSLVCCMGAPADAGVWRTFRYLRPGVFVRAARVGEGENHDERVESLVEVFRAFASPGYPFPEEWARATAAISDERAPRDPSTTQRQLAAGRAHQSRPLESITAPTLVIAGTDDPLIRWHAGRDIARRVPGARFRRHDGMGHDIPKALFDAVITDVRANANREPT